MSEESTPIVSGLNGANESTPSDAMDGAGRHDELPNALDLHDAASGVQAVVYEFPATIGNAIDCDLPLKGPGPSGVYAHVRRESGAFIIERAHSEVPLVISEKQLRSVILADDDRIVLGEHEIRVRFIHMDPSEMNRPGKRERYEAMLTALLDIDYAAKATLLKERARQWTARFEKLRSQSDKTDEQAPASRGTVADKPPMPNRRLVLYAVAAFALAIILASFIKLMSGVAGPPDVDKNKPRATHTGSIKTSGRTHQSMHGAGASSADHPADGPVQPGVSASRVLFGKSPISISRLSVPEDSAADSGSAAAPEALTLEVSNPQVDDDAAQLDETVAASHESASVEPPKQTARQPPSRTTQRSKHRESPAAGSPAADKGASGTTSTASSASARPKVEKSPSTQQVVRTARRQYTAGDAPAALVTLEQGQHSSVASSQRAQLQQRIRQAFNAYSSGRKAYAQRDFDGLLTARDRLISDEALMKTQDTSTYRISLDRMALPILRQRATTAYDAQDMALAYRLYTSVLHIASNDSVAQDRRRQIVARAKAYYIQGYRLEPKDLKSAMSAWQKAATILPSGTRWHDQSVAKINKYKALMKQG